MSGEARKQARLAAPLVYLLRDAFVAVVVSAVGCREAPKAATEVAAASTPAAAARPPSGDKGTVAGPATGAQRSEAKRILKDMSDRAASKEWSGNGAVFRHSRLERRVLGFDGIAASVRIRRNDSDARIVLVTVHSETVLVERGLAAGALGYVLKDSAGDDLVAAVRAALGGERYVRRVLRPGPPPEE